VSHRGFLLPRDVDPTTATGEPAAVVGFDTRRIESDLADLARLQALLTLLRLELHTLALREVAEALHLDLGLMHEEIIPAAVRRNETETFFGVEPLNCAYTHN
jgi:hypothetical protein